MLSELLERAKRDEPIYMPELRRLFEEEGKLPLKVYVLPYEGEGEGFSFPLPCPEGKEEEAFVASYLYANLYNLLSVRGARGLEVYTDLSHPFLASLAQGLPEVFQVEKPPLERRGYGRCLNVNQRVLSFLGEEEAFRMEIRDIAEWEEKEKGQGKQEAEEAEGKTEQEEGPAEEKRNLKSLPGRAARGRYLGIDIGGTDIKAAASLDGNLALCAEYDWNPSELPGAEEFMRPILALTRLLHLGLLLLERGRGEEIPREALTSRADLEMVERAVSAMEELLGEEAGKELWDGIGVSFPDVVIADRIVGGETQKTQGFYASGDYEAEFRRLGDLGERLHAFVKEGGRVSLCNDGSMAAFTAAVEHAALGEEQGEDSLCHSLGTDLGTGWVTPEGRIPSVPLEAYRLLIDLGSYGGAAYPAGDVRSTRGMTSDLPGCIQRYASQNAVFRSAALAGEGGGFIREEGGLLTVPPEQRKAALSHYMALAGRNPEGVHGRAFFRVGTALAAAYQELTYFLPLKPSRISVYGRLVKDGACGRLIREGARSVLPSLEVETAGGELCASPLMCQLRDHETYTVAQFGQAVGAIYFAA